MNKRQFKKFVKAHCGTFTKGNYTIVTGCYFNEYMGELAKYVYIYENDKCIMHTSFANRHTNESLEQQLDGWLEVRKIISVSDFIKGE